MELLRGVDENIARQAIVRGLTNVAADLGVQVLAEGVETEGEFKTLAGMGVRLFQGYYFGRPHVGAVESGKAFGWAA
jgi:EAL domain-containing protein (putative c-di-GMP-specific phosphodiesterase class I)